MLRQRTKFQYNKNRIFKQICKEGDIDVILSFDYDVDWRLFVESTIIQPGSHKKITRVHTHNRLHVSSRDTSASR